MANDPSDVANDLAWLQANAPQQYAGGKFIPSVPPTQNNPNGPSQNPPAASYQNLAGLSYVLDKDGNIVGITKEPQSTVTSGPNGEIRVTPSATPPKFPPPLIWKKSDVDTSPTYQMAQANPLNTFRNAFPPASSAPPPTQSPPSNSQYGPLGFLSGKRQSTTSTDDTSDQPEETPSTVGPIAKQYGIGVAQGAADAVNFAAHPVDTVTSAVSRGLVHLHDILAPTLGYRPFPPDVKAELLDQGDPGVGTRILDKISTATSGQPISFYEPTTPGQSAARFAGQMTVPALSVASPLLGLSKLGGSAAYQADAATENALMRMAKSPTIQKDPDLIGHDWWSGSPMQTGAKIAPPSPQNILAKYSNGEDYAADMMRQRLGSTPPTKYDPTVQDMHDNLVDEFERMKAAASRNQ